VEAGYEADLEDDEVDRGEKWARVKKFLKPDQAKLTVIGKPTKAIITDVRKEQYPAVRSATAEANHHLMVLKGSIHW
jgi:hypothetical protein